MAAREGHPFPQSRGSLANGTPVPTLSICKQIFDADQAGPCPSHTLGKLSVPLIQSGYRHATVSLKGDCVLLGQGKIPWTNIMNFHNVAQCNVFHDPPVLFSPTELCLYVSVYLHMFVDIVLVIFRETGKRQREEEEGRGRNGEQAKTPDQR